MKNYFVISVFLGFTQLIDLDNGAQAIQIRPHY